MVDEVASGLRTGLSLLVTPGQAGDGPQFTAVLDGIEVPKTGGGRPRSRAVRVLAGKAYSSRGNREWLRRHGIRVTIPVPADQAGHRRNRGSGGGRPPVFDPVVYRDRNAVARVASNSIGRWPLATTRSLSAIWRWSTSLRSISGCDTGGVRQSDENDLIACWTSMGDDRSLRRLAHPELSLRWSCPGCVRPSDAAGTDRRPLRHRAFATYCHRS